MLVGREAQVAVVATLVERARQGAGQVLVVEGEAGIGKSALLGEGAELAAGAGFAVRIGQADELGATRPFAPLVDALGEPARVAVHRRSSSLEQPAVPAVLESDPGLQSLVVDELVDQVEAQCVEQPVALVLDDLHWADASTLMVLSSLLRRTTDLPLLLVLSARPIPRGRELSAFLDLVPAAARLELARLGDAEVAQLAARLLGAGPGPGLSGLLDGCAGNPLLVVELLAALGDGGLLVPRGELIDADAAGTIALPTTLGQAVRRRMAALDDELQAVATVAALLGTRFTLGDLAAVTERSPTELLPVIQVLVDARLVVDDGTSLSYRHDLVREAVTSALPASVRQELHRGIADALRSAGAPTLRVAEQVALGATPGSPEAVAVLCEAAEELATQDPAGAESLLRRALEVAAPTDPARVLLRARLVDVLVWSGRLQEGESLADDVLAHPVPAEAEIVLRSALSRALLLLARPAEAMAHVDRLVQLHRETGRSTAWPRAESGVCRVFGLDLDGALADAVAAVEAGKDDGDEMAVILGLSVQAFARTASGDSAVAVEGATEAVERADATPGGEGHRLHPQLFRGIALQSLGDHVAAGRALDRGRTLGEALGATWALPIYHFLTALGCWDRGEWDDLLTEIDAGLRQCEERSSSIGEAWAYGVAGRVHVHRGELDRAAEALDRGDRLVAERGAQFGVDWILVARALLLEAQGRRPDGLELLTGMWEAAAGLQASASLVLAGGDLARLAVDAGDEVTAGRVVAELGVLAERTPDDLVVRGREARARGLVERDPAVLEDAVAHFEQLGHRFEAALVRTEVAELRAADGDRDQVVAALEAAIGTFDDIGASAEGDRARSHLARLTSQRRRQSPRRPSTGWEALTPTEWLVVEEVSAGRSNPEAAERLGISRRTVDAHLRSIYTKLGVSTRLALAVAFRDRPEGREVV